jgi:hypothetical protein
VFLVGGLSLVVIVVSRLATPDPGTEPHPVQVEFDAPAGCADANSFFSSLRSRTNRVRQAEENEPHTTLRVRLAQMRGYILGELRVVDDRGRTDTRKVQGANCDDVVQALSLTAALAVDPSVLLSAPAAPPERATSPEATAPPEPAVPPKPAAPPELATTALADRAPGAGSQSLHAPIPRFEFGVSPVGATLLSSSFSLGVALSARMTLTGSGVFRPTMGLGAAYLRNDVLQSPGVAQASLTGIAATVCPLRLSASIVTLQPCGLALGGWLTVLGHQAEHTYSVDRLWLSAGGVLRISAYLGRGLSLEVETGITAPFIRRRFFTTTQDNVVRETPTISPIASLGLVCGI